MAICERQGFGMGVKDYIREGRHLIRQGVIGGGRLLDSSMSGKYRIIV